MRESRRSRIAVFCMCSFLFFFLIISVERFIVLGCVVVLIDWREKVCCVVSGVVVIKKEARSMVRAVRT